MNGDTCPRCKRFIQEGWDHQCPPEKKAKDEPIPMTPYAEQAEQAREFLESLKEGCWIQENNVAPFQLAEKNLYHKIQSELIEALDTLARVEAVVSQEPHNTTDFAKGYNCCRNEMLKALEGE